MQLEIPAGPFRAYIFDCDGTVVDSMPLHYRAWKAALAEWNCDFPEDLFYSWGGKPVRNIIADLNQIYSLAMPIDSLAVRKVALYLAQLPSLKAIPEVVEHITAQHGRIPFAVASGSRKDSVVGSLTTVGLLDRFDAIVTAGDYIQAKPAPDCFLLAAQRLGVAPKDCLVFEDTQLGIQAATAAGMASVMVPFIMHRS